MLRLGRVCAYMPHPAVELSMIVRNGGASLARCLRSARPLVDRIVIGDTGSTDDSRAIAENFGAEVISIQWQDDFAAARNQVLAMARCEWVLVLDADEMLNPVEAASLLPGLLRDNGVHAYTLTRRDYVDRPHLHQVACAVEPNPGDLPEARKYPGYVRSVHTRLFRRHPEVYFRERVHEQVTSTIDCLGLLRTNAPLTIHHFGPAETTADAAEEKVRLYHRLGLEKIASAPESFEAQLQLGIAELLQRNSPEKALPFLQRASDLRPNDSRGPLYAGICLLRLDRIAEARQSLLRAFALGEDSPALHDALGDALLCAGEHEHALTAYQRAYLASHGSPLAATKIGLAALHLQEAKRGEEPETLIAVTGSKSHTTPQKGTGTHDVSLATIFDQALEHHRDGRVAEAEQGYRQILDADPNHADSLHLLGMLAYEAGDCETAMERIRRAIAIHPRASSYHLNLGNVLQHLGLARDAGGCYLNALRIKPDLVEAQVNLGHLFLAAEDTANAIEWYERALSLRPEMPEAHKKLGDAYRVALKTDLAIASYRRAIALKPDYADALHELGILLRSAHDLDGALACFREALAAEPDHPRAGFAEALLLLLQGNFREGWAAYECRWASADHATPMRAYPQPRWQGQPVDGSVLLWPEQGIGDEIMFSSAVPDAIRTGTRCILQCDARLQPLFARSFPEVEVISDSDAGFDPAREIAAQLPLGSLPGLYRRDRNEFASSASPYLRADPARREHYRSRYANGEKIVGLAWFSNNVKTGKDRSIDLEQVNPLLAVPGTRWISLQYGDLPTLGAEIAETDAAIYVDPEVDQLRDIDEFAAQVAAMDLVITIDNTTAHLAGALGVPVWLLLPFAPDWRWPECGGGSPWYPSMRIFQQPERGDWTSVVAEVGQVLRPL